MAVKIVWDLVTLKQVVNSAKVVAEQVTFYFSPEAGLRLRGISEHKITMVAADIPPTGFKEYICDHGFEFSINVKNLKMIFGRTKKTTDSVTMTLNEDSRLVILFDGKEFTSKLVTAKDSRDPPQLPFTGFVEADLSELNDILEDAGLGDKADAEYDDTAFNVVVDEPKVTFSRQNDSTSFKTDKEHNGKEWVVSGFGEVKITLSFLSNVVKGLKGTADKAKLSFGQKGVPMMLEVGIIKYLIAPRVKD